MFLGSFSDFFFLGNASRFNEALAAFRITFIKSASGFISRRHRGGPQVEKQEKAALFSKG